MLNRFNDKAGNEYIMHDVFSPERNRVSYGNGKTGFASINFLAGNRDETYNGYLPAPVREWVQENGVCGTCSGTCPGCYARKTTRYFRVSITDILNTIEIKLNPVRFYELVEAELDRDGWPETIRLHDSGEFDSLAHFTATMDFVIRHPGTRFYGYTKEAGLVNAYGYDRIKAIKNLAFSCSPWPGYCEPIYDMAQFCYDDGSNPELAKLPHCPAVDRNGKRTGVQCKDCNHCPNAKPGDRWAVYAHG